MKQNKFMLNKEKRVLKKFFRKARDNETCYEKCNYSESITQNEAKSTQIEEKFKKEENENNILPVWIIKT